MRLDRFADAAQRPTDSLPLSTATRRGFLKATAAVGGGLLLSFGLPPANGRAAAAGGADGFAPNAFVRIGPDGQATLIMPQVEMGQGTYTSLPMLIAEELEVDLSDVHLEHAAADDQLYANLLLGFQVTGNSNSVRAFFEPLRRAGATARSMLIAAAPETWQVDASTCRAEKGAVIHDATGRALDYGKLVDKAATLPVPENVALKDAKDWRLIGTPAKRLDTADKVNGRAVFGIDVQLPGMKVATLAACPVFGGRLAGVDDSKAMAVKGVRQVVRLDDAVAVVADHMGAAKKGLAALDIEWDEGPNATLGTADVVRELEVASQRVGAVARREGDVEKAMASAATKVEAVYQVPFLAHATMEPMNCTVDLRQDSCEVWVGTQVLSRAQAAAAQTAGLPLEKVKVHNHLLGGGFGRRLEIDGIVRAVQIAKYVDGPVKVIWTREEDIQHDMYRPYFFDRISAGLDEKGMPVAWNHRFAGSSIVARWLPPAFNNGLDPDTTDGAIDLSYALPNMRVEYVRVEPPGIPTAFWRSVGPSHNVFVVESFMDELAAAAKQDPIEYRRALLDKAPRAKAVLVLGAGHVGDAGPEVLGANDVMRFCSIVNKRHAPKYLAEIWDLLTELYTSAGGTFFGAEYADQKQRPRQDIAQPCCCVHATTVPEPFWAALQQGSMVDGSLARFLVFQTDNEVPDRNGALGRSAMCRTSWCRRFKRSPPACRGMAAATSRPWSRGQWSCPIATPCR
jgi:isoquinoline 1-oxidoreductase subunit beta